MKKLVAISLAFVALAIPASAGANIPPGDGGICSVWHVIATGQVCKCYAWGC